MKSRWYLISSIFQIIVGLAAIVAFVVLAIKGESFNSALFSFAHLQMFHLICMLRSERSGDDYVPEKTAKKSR